MGALSKEEGGQMKTIPMFGDKVHWLEPQKEDYTHKELSPKIHNCIVEKVLVEIRESNGVVIKITLDNLKKGWTE